MEVPTESFHRSSWDSRTCYARRAFNRGLTDDCSPGHGLVLRFLSSWWANARPPITRSFSLLLFIMNGGCRWHRSFKIHHSLWKKKERACACWWENFLTEPAVMGSLKDGEVKRVWVCWTRSTQHACWTLNSQPLLSFKEQTDSCFSFHYECRHCCRMTSSSHS